MAKKRFKITATSDFGRETFLDLVVGEMKKRQSNMIVHEVKSFVEARGRPFMNTALVEIPGEIDLPTMREWTLDCLRLFYKGPPFVLMVEEEIEDGGASLVVPS